jgi:hypothetical protein
MGREVGMRLPLKHKDKFEKIVIMTSIGFRGLVGDRFRAHVDKRLEAQKTKIEIFLSAITQKSCFAPSYKPRSGRTFKSTT